MIGAEGSDDQITVPLMFETDFASIPRPFWAILPKWGKYGNAAVIHDWLYWEQQRLRAADSVLLEGMVALEVNSLVRNIIYAAVRFFGWVAWYRNRVDRTDGYNRVSLVTPIKAMTTSQRQAQYVQLARHLLRQRRSIFQG